MESQDKFDRHTYSYLALRKSVGWIGMLLPVVLATGAVLIFQEEGIRKSISHYYHSDMGDVLVGALCAIGLFMFFYTGYNKLDNWIGNLAGLFAIGIAWFPTMEKPPIDIIGIIHFICAAGFFLATSFFSLFLFTRSKKDSTPTPRKKTRNKVYVLCGVMMLLCLLGIVIYLFTKSTRETTFVFWAETIALIFFGISWLTKGETLFPDKQG